MRRKVEREMAAHVRRARGGRVWPYLNNFHCRLPGGVYRRIYTPAELDEPYLQLGASALMRSLTPRQFFSRVDQVIAELGLDMKTIQSLQKLSSLEVHDYAFSVYLRLREDGFKHYPDLTS